MFRNSLIGSIILHVLFIIGVNFTLSNNAVSKDKEPPLCLELVGEPAGTKESVRIAGNAKMQQSKASQKRPSVSRVTEETPPAASAEFQDSLKTTATVETGESISDLQTPTANEPGDSVKTDSDPPVDSQNPGTDGADGMGDIDGNDGNGDIGLGLRRGQLLYAPQPNYPAQARRNNWEGAALLEVRIGLDGRIQKVTILQSSGYPLLDRTAEKAIQKWRYRPVIKDGVAIAWQTRIRIKFVLED